MADDSRLQRRILTSLLEKAGFEVTEAASGDEALSVMEDNSISVVISDWMMPGMDGPTLCKALRAQQRDSYVYFILLTSKAEKEDIAAGLDAGADDFLTKPVNGDELRARLMAGQRILKMESELHQKNKLIANTLNELQAVYDSVDRDLIEARKLQHSLMREPFVDYGKAQVSLFLKSSGRVGGDLVGTYPISQSRIGFYAIDVSGHGIASALLTARLAGHLSATAPNQNVALEPDDNGGYRPLPPCVAVARLNSLILEDIDTEHYFTIVLADMDLASGKVTFCQAGHPHPVLHRADGSVEFIGNGGLPVGLIAMAEYEDHVCDLCPGDRLVVYSDGVTESADFAGELYDDAGLEVFLQRGKIRGASFFDSLLDDLKKHVGDDEFADDISTVLLEYSG